MTESLMKESLFTDSFKDSIHTMQLGLLKLECVYKYSRHLVKMQILIRQVWGVA